MRSLAARAGHVITALACLFAAAYTSSLVFFPKPHGRIVMGDALHHYVQLRSVVFDGDLHFRNEYVRLYGVRGDEPGTDWIFEQTSVGYVRNLMPVGPAILWAPLFLVVTTATWLGQFAGWQYPVDGYGRLFQASAGLTGVAAAAVGVWLSFRTAAAFFSYRSAAWAAVVLWLSSSAIYYSLVSPTYSHAASLLTTSLFWFAFVRTQGVVTVTRFLVLGALAGTAALMRWQDAVILTVPAVELLWRLTCPVSVRDSVPGGCITLTRAALLGAACLGAALAAFSPQMLAWQIIYGHPFTIPQGAGFMRWEAPALISVLFSDWHGLFTWTPVTAIAVMGLAWLRRREPLIFTAAGTFLLISWYVNAAAADWWAGEAFGARRFVSCFTPFVLGLAALIERWSPAMRTLALAGVAIVAHTWLLLLQYQAYMHGLGDVVPYPMGAFNLWVARFVVPVDLIGWWTAR